MSKIQKMDQRCQRYRRWTSEVKDTEDGPVKDTEDGPVMSKIQNMDQ